MATTLETEAACQATFRFPKLVNCQGHVRPHSELHTPGARGFATRVGKRLSPPEQVPRGVRGWRGERAKDRGVAWQPFLGRFTGLPLWVPRTPTVRPAVRAWGAAPW